MLQLFFVTRSVWSLSNSLSVVHGWAKFGLPDGITLSHAADQPIRSNLGHLVFYVL